MTLPLFSASHTHWIQQCLTETAWQAWTPVQPLGEGGYSMAVLVKRRNTMAVLLMDRPDRPPSPPDFPTSIQSYESNMLIRQECRNLGMKVPETLEAPRAWSGGAAVLMTRIQGQDHGRAMLSFPLDARKIGGAVARLVQRSQGLGQAHPDHAHGFGRHLFGKPAIHDTTAQAFSKWISPLKGNDPSIDDLVGSLEEKAGEVFRHTPRTTQIWDVGDRNVMIGQTGRVVGLVDQADMYSGDPMFVPGFSIAMLGDLHGWSQIQDYEAGWRKAWGANDEDWARVQLHRLSSHGRLAGKQWRRNGHPPPSFNGWAQRATRLLETL